MSVAKRSKTGGAKAAFLVLKSNEFSAASSKCIELEAGVRLTLGRNDTVLGITDKNVSRTQAIVEASLDLQTVVVEAGGVNALELHLKSGAAMELKKGQRAELRDGDRFWLLPDKYEIHVEIEQIEPSQADDGGDDDDGTELLEGDEGDDTGERGTRDQDKTVVVAVDDAAYDAAHFSYEDSYQFVTSESSRRALQRNPWNAEAWLRWFDFYSSRGAYNEAAVRAMRILVLETTVDAVRRGSYTPQGARGPISLDQERMRKGVLRSEMHASFTFSEKLAQRRFTEPAKIVVKECDCIEAALHLKLDKKCNVAVLNMANATRPGGGYKTGAGAQEENLHRRSNLHQHLEDPDGEFPARTWTYPIPEFGAIYSPDVAFFRTSEDLGYDWMPQAEFLDVVSIAADFKPKLIEREAKIVTSSDSDPSFGVQVELRLAHEFEARMKKRVLHILGLCVARGHDAVVLSAFGCGAFRNPPRHVAQIFRDTIKEYAFHYHFRFIMFAIIDDHNARQSHNPRGNFEPFYEVFYKRLPDRTVAGHPK
jgi:uncharacterized protein (TIGR02452 family)